MRKLEREVGPLRFVLFSDDPTVLDAVIAWKRDQNLRIRSVDHLAPDRTREFLRRISATWVGDEFNEAELEDIRPRPDEHVQPPRRLLTRRA